MIKSLIIFMSVFAIPIVHASESQEHSKTDMKYSILAIEYIGESDAPIPAVVISDSEAGAEWYRCEVLRRPKFFTYKHVIDAALLEKLIAEAESFESAARPERERIPESGGGDVSMTVIRPRKKNTFFYYTETAIAQVDSLLKHCKGNESLRSDLLKFQERIRRF